MPANEAWNYALAAYAVAVICIYAALDLGQRLAYFDGWRGARWTLAGALTLGSGIWSTHLLGMDAAGLPPGFRYDVLRLTESWVVAVATSGLALFLLGQRVRPAIGTLVFGGALMGFGMFAMHGVAVSALRGVHLQPPAAVDAGAAAALVCLASILALQVYYAAPMRDIEDRWIEPVKLVAAMIMGGALCVMHGLAAGRLPVSAALAGESVTVPGRWLELASAVTAVIGVGIVIILSLRDERALRERRRRDRARISADRLGAP